MLTAASGPAALALMAAEPVDLLITDQRMPAMTGLELVQRAREAHPALPCLLCTGYTEESQLREAMAGDQVAVLYKPWAPRALRQGRLTTFAPG